MPWLTHNNQEAGNTLIEVLIATLLIALVVGLAGQATSQANAAFNSMHAQRTAHLLVNNMFETLRSVPAAGLSALPEARSLTCTATDNCTTNDWLATQIYAWQTAAGIQLPEGNARMELTPDGLHIRVTWLSAQNLRLQYSDLYTPG